MVDISKLTPEQAKLFNDLKANGLTAEELKQLEIAGVKEELLNAMKTEFPDTGEIPKGEPKDANPPKEESSFWEKLGVVGLVTGAFATVGAAIGGVVGFIGGGGVGAAPGAIAGAKAGACLGGLISVALSLTSCSESPITQEVEVNLTIESSNEELIAHMEKIYNTLQDMVKYLISLGADVNRMVTILTQMGNDLSEITKVLVENGVKADKIIELIQQNNEQLDAILDKLTEGQNADAKAREEIKDMLAKIIDLVSKGNELGGKNNELLTQILAKLATTNDKEGIALLKEILAKLTESIEQNRAFGEKTHMLLHDILDKLNTMDAARRNEAKMVIAAINALGANADKYLEKIVANQGLTQQDLDEIKELIMKNNEIAQGTQNAVKDLSTKMSEEHKAILEKISAGNATLDDILKVLHGIKNDTSVIGDIKQFTNLIGSAIEKLLEEVQGLRVETKQSLLAILAKIPEGCKCEHGDITVLLDKLDVIIEELKNDPEDKENPKHEGVLDDLEDYFG